MPDPQHAATRSRAVDAVSTASSGKQRRWTLGEVCEDHDGNRRAAESARIVLAAIEQRSLAKTPRLLFGSARRCRTDRR